jgi:hypothetical protein
MYQDPFGFDPQRPRDLLRQGAYINMFIEAGSLRAMIAMADDLLDKGDRDASLAWMDRVERSIADDDFVSPIYLSSAYRRGLGRGTPSERQRKALRLLEGVAESGNVAAIHELMTSHLHGTGGAPKDQERFVSRARKAVVLGSEAAVRALRREGVPVPDRTAVPA